MRELSQQEIHCISGGGYVQDLSTYYGSTTGALLGFALGAIVPIISPLTAAAGWFVGSQIGLVTGNIFGGCLEKILP